MDKLDFGALLRRYLRARRKCIAAFLLAALLFWLVYALYQLPVEPVFYASLLCAALGMLYGVYDFYRFSRKYRALQTVLSGIRTHLELLPAPSDLLEESYQELLQTLHRERVSLISAADRRYGEMTDYYTLWAHQIKTPISAMRLMLQVEDDSSARPELEHALFEIERYVEMVLQYLRLDSISSDLVLRPYPLDGIVRQAVKKYAPVFIHRKIALEYQELECSVVTDEKWMTFVLEQLLSNALKYTKKGSVMIGMDPEREKTLLLRDTGIGIRPEDVPRVFERGYTGYNGRMDKKSTGLGLYLCKRILSRLGHTIEITSEVGRGTEVRLGLSSEELEVE